GVLSPALGVAMLFAFSSRPDSLAAVTVVPVWVWFLFGVVLSLLSGRAGGGKLLAAGMSAWLLFFVLYAPELRSLLRFPIHNDAEWQAAKKEGSAVRVVTLNCFVGTRGAVEEALSQDAEIVMVQEIPPPRELLAMCKRQQKQPWDVVWGNDVAILFRGELLEQRAIEGTHGVGALIRLPSGERLLTVTFRLQSAVFNANLFLPSVWQRHTANRHSRRKELRAVAKFVLSFPRDVPVVLGGDFNAPVGDPIFEEMPKELRDAFEEAGSGWGNTIFNSFPIHRIDRVFVSSHFKCIRVRALKTEHSDHRLVSADLVLEEKGT
ncbi:MAG: hypothetical protein C4342_01765, partial [Armatimonadota bacterium]